MSTRQRTISSPLQNPTLAREGRPALPRNGSSQQGWSQGHIRRSSSTSARSALAEMLAHGHHPVPPLPASPPRPTVVMPAPNLQVQSTAPPTPTTNAEKQKRSLWKRRKSRLPPPKKSEIVERPPLDLPALGEWARLSASNLLQQVEMSVARQEQERAMILQLASDASASHREDEVEELAGFSHRPTGRDILPPQVRHDLTALLTESRAAFAASTDDAPIRKKSVKPGKERKVEKERKAEKEKRAPNRLRKTRPKRESGRPISFRAPSPPPLPLPAPSPQPPLELPEQIFGEKRTSMLDYDWLARSSMLFPSLPPSTVPTTQVAADKTRRRRSSVPTRLPSAEYSAIPVKPQPQAVQPGVANRFQRARVGSLNRGETTIAAAISHVMATEGNKLRSPRAEKRAQAGNELRVAGWLQRVDAPMLAFRPASVLSEEAEEEQDRPLFAKSLLARANSDASVMDPEMHSLRSTPIPFAPPSPSYTSLTSRHTPITARSPSPTPSSHVSSVTAIPSFRSSSPTSLISTRTFGSPTPTLRPPGTAPRLNGRISPGPPSPGLPYDRSRSPSPLTIPTSPPRRHVVPTSRQARARTGTNGSAGSLTHASSESGDSELASLESPRDILPRLRVAVIDATAAPFSTLDPVEPRFIYKTSKPKPRALADLTRSISQRTAMTASVYSDVSEVDTSLSMRSKIDVARQRRETLYKRTAAPNRLW